MRSILYLSTSACLALWDNHASAFVLTPNFRSCQGVVCRPDKVVSVGMAENFDDSESDVTDENEAPVEVTLESTEAAAEEVTEVEKKEAGEEEETETGISGKDTSIEKKETKDVPWMELLGAAAELAGALGSAAAQAASSALDDMAPKEEIDVSIPYDSACSQAYTKWLTKYEKEDPDLERYEIFKRNYQTVAVTNVIAKKKIREGIPEGEETPEILELNKYADLSEEEYKEVQKSLEPKTWGDLFSELASVAGKATMDLATGVASPKSGDEPDIPAKGNTKFVPAKKPVAKKPAVKKVASKKPIPRKALAKKKEPATNDTFTFFGFGTKSVTKSTQHKKKQAPKRVFQKAAPAKKAAPVVRSFPVLTRWKQNKDGSLTGYVSNSSSFRTGTRITTSPVPKGAKGGSVVRTGSGSRYRLK